MGKLVHSAVWLMILGACLHVAAAPAERQVRFKTTPEVARALGGRGAGEWIPARVVAAGRETLTFAIGKRGERAEIPRGLVRELQVRRSGTRGPWIAASPRARDLP